MRPFLATLALAGLSSAAGLALQVMPMPHLPGTAGMAGSAAVSSAADDISEAPQVLATTPLGVVSEPVSVVLSGAAATAPAREETTATAAPAADAAEPTSPAADLAPDARKAAALFDVMNTARLEHGLQMLGHSSALDGVALVRANDLAKKGYFDHISPTGQSAFTELNAMAVRYRIAGENLARNNYLEGRTVQAAFDALMASPGHRANILEERFGLVGVAVVRNGQMWLYVTVFMD